MFCEPRNGLKTETLNSILIGHSCALTTRCSANTYSDDNRRVAKVSADMTSPVAFTLGFFFPLLLDALVQYSRCGRLITGAAADY